jgi:cell wall-associated NlpC family hydrolase
MTSSRIAMNLAFRTTLSLLLAALSWSCTPLPQVPGGPVVRSPAPTDPIAELLATTPATSEPGPALETMGYSVQVGAFSSLDNAVRLERRLADLGIDAYYFRHESGLYKVRFGNHTEYQPARAQAEQLQSQGLIGEFFIVVPEAYPIAGIPDGGRDALRADLVRTARRFVGVPYRWGGTDSEVGFDCSGLTMVSSRLNGLNLPRVSRNQFQAGRQISRAELQPGDLVFFATRGGQQVTHVGMYIGGDAFLQAPRTGQKVRIEQMSHPFYAKTYRGGRNYL